MGNDQHGDMLRQVHTLFTDGTSGGLTDGQLLERFVARRGEGAEPAFAALVGRHGPMVLRACRAILHDDHEAQDAFQATFLVLARKAGSLWVRDSIGPWLHEVACRTASCARTAAARRRARERRAAGMATRQSEDEGDGIDLGPALHEEVERLPERQRRPVVLCYLEGLTHEQAARQLNWPVGTVRSRLARGRERLRSRLIRRGLAPSAALLGAASSAGTTSAAVPAALAEVTVRAAVQFATVKAAMAGTVPASAAALAELILRTMLMTRIKAAMTGLLMFGAVAIGAVGLAQPGPAVPPQPQPRGPQQEIVGERPAFQQDASRDRPLLRDQSHRDEPARLPMEYRVLEGVYSNDLGGKLNTLEREGWEVFQVLPQHLVEARNNSAQYVIVARRLVKKG